MTNCKPRPVHNGRNRDRGSRARDLKKAAAEAGLSRSQYDRVRDLALKRMGAAPRANGELVKTPPAGLPTDYTPVESIKEIAEAEKWEKLFARASRQTVTRRRARERLFPNPPTGGSRHDRPLRAVNSTAPGPAHTPWQLPGRVRSPGIMPGRHISPSRGAVLWLRI